MGRDISYWGFCWACWLIGPARIQRWCWLVLVEGFTGVFWVLLEGINARSGISGLSCNLYMFPFSESVLHYPDTGSLCLLVEPPVEYIIDYYCLE